MARCYEGGIILNEYESAIFIAREKCRSPKRRKTRELLYWTFVPSTMIINGEKVSCESPVKNPDYRPYEEGELEAIRQEENEQIYKFLKEKYPNTNYAEEFKKYEIEKGEIKQC